MVVVLFGPAVRPELAEAMAWYRERSESLAEGFLAELDAAVARVAANPSQFPVVFADVRRARLRRFPYALFFRAEDDIARVIACFHSSRDPRRWQSRAQ